LLSVDSHKQPVLYLALETKRKSLQHDDACNLYDIINRDFLYSKSLEKHNGI